MSKVILALETSCDDSAVAVMKDGTLASHVVATQLVHKDYGGVVPELAARAHQRYIVPLVDRALREASCQRGEVDAIAVTQGPGLMGSLMVGVSFANGYGFASGIPLLPVHHIKAHLLANLLSHDDLHLPALGIVVSGGHTQLIEVVSSTEMRLLGSSLDDAVGEVIDKSMRLLGGPYPGGAAMEKLAKAGNPRRFPYPMAKTAPFHFSFSGVKTAFLYHLQREEEQCTGFTERNKADLAASIQWTLMNTVVVKVEEAMAKVGHTTLLVGGGVARNGLLRALLKARADEKGWLLLMPLPAFCTDNAAMVGIAGYHLWEAGVRESHVVPMARMAF